MTKRGGKRPGAGRPPGSKTKVGADLRVAAQQYSDEALKTLVEVMRNKKTGGAARAAAANAVLDRGYGKPKQEIEANINLFDRMSDDEQRAIAAALETISRDEGEHASGTAPTHH